MPYVTTIKEPKGSEISLDELLCHEVDIQKPKKKRYYPGTVTKYYSNLPEWLYPSQDIQRIAEKLQIFAARVAHYPEDMSSEYRHFQIPKQNGRKRDIYEPSRRLSNDHVELRTILETDFHAAYHTSAFAYCKNRSPLYSIRRHQANQSKWFLKLDFSDFFANTTFDFTWSQLAEIAPFSEVVKNKEGADALRKALRICFLNNGLPQGTPISPMLTNLVMIPIDHEISNRLHKNGFVYTRYADDILISSREKFSVQEIVNVVKETLQKHNAPYTIKNEKTRFGSSSGRNWNLGIMLNKENQITIGHENHKTLKAKLHSFIMDEKNGKPWNLKEVEKLNGYLAYFKSIEPSYAKYLINHINKKHSIIIEKTISNKLRETKLNIIFTL